MFPLVVADIFLWMCFFGCFLAWFGVVWRVGSTMLFSCCFPTLLRLLHTLHGSCPNFQTEDNPSVFIAPELLAPPAALQHAHQTPQPRLRSMAPLAFCHACLYLIPGCLSIATVDRLCLLSLHSTHQPPRVQNRGGSAASSGLCAHGGFSRCADSPKSCGATAQSSSEWRGHESSMSSKGLGVYLATLRSAATAPSQPWAAV